MNMYAKINDMPKQQIAKPTSGPPVQTHAPYYDLYVNVNVYVNVDVRVDLYVNIIYQSFNRG